jgi:hypothetical protein
MTLSHQFAKVSMTGFQKIKTTRPKMQSAWTNTTLDWQKVLTQNSTEIKGSHLKKAI